MPKMQEENLSRVLAEEHKDYQATQAPVSGVEGDRQLLHLQGKRAVPETRTDRRLELEESAGQKVSSVGKRRGESAADQELQRQSASSFLTERKAGLPASSRQLRRAEAP